VRFPLMRPRFLFHCVEKQPLVMQCACMQGLLLEAYRYHALIEDDEESAAEAASSSSLSSSSSSVAMLHATAGVSTSARSEAAPAASSASSASMLSQQQQQQQLQQQYRRRSSKDLILISLSAAAAAAATVNSNSASASASDHAGLLAFGSTAGGSSIPSLVLTNQSAADADVGASADAAHALSAEEAAELAAALAVSLLPDRFRERGLEHVIFGPTSGTFYNCSSSISHNHPLSNLRRKNDKYWLPSDAESAQVRVLDASLLVSALPHVESSKFGASWINIIPYFVDFSCVLADWHHV
jgi:hypothetical protein